MTYMSNVAVINNAVKEGGYELKHVAVEEGDDYSFKPLQLYLTPNISQEVARDLLAGMKLIDLKIKVIDKSSKDKGKPLTFIQ